MFAYMCYATASAVHELGVEPCFERKALADNTATTGERLTRRGMRRRHPAITRPWHQHLTSLGCLFLLLAYWFPVTSCSSLTHAGGDILQVDSTAALSHLGKRSKDETLAKAEVVEDLEVFTHAEETAERVHSDAGLPYGRQVQVRSDNRFRAFAE